MPSCCEIGWSLKRQKGTSHRILARPDGPDLCFAFHDCEELGPRMLARLAKRSGLKPEDLANDHPASLLNRND